MLRPGIDGVKRNVSKLIQGVNGVKTEVTEYWSSEGGVKKLVYRASPYDPVLNNNSWELIRQASDEGIASSLWSVGDRKAVTLNGMCNDLKFNNETYYVYILGFDHNSAREGKKRIHFQFGFTALSGGKQIAFTGGNFVMRKTMTNSGGWEDSFMRNTICSEFKNCLPSDLKNIIKTTTKYSDNTGGGSDISSYVSSTKDAIFLLSEFEVFGDRIYANSAEKGLQAQYQYYKNGNSKVKYEHNSTDNKVLWWMRSVNVNNLTGFCIVDMFGDPYYYFASAEMEFSPAFCV